MKFRLNIIVAIIMWVNLICFLFKFTHNGWRYGVGLPCRLFQPTTTVNDKLHYTECYQTVFIN